VTGAKPSADAWSVFSCSPSFASLVSLDVELYYALVAIFFSRT
jgi:hypothetical protein